MILGPEHQHFHLSERAQVDTLLALHTVIGLITELLHVPLEVLQSKSTFADLIRLEFANNLRAAVGFREEFLGTQLGLGIRNPRRRS